MFEKEENMKIDETFMNNLVEHNLSYLSPRENERVKVARKVSQEFGTCYVNDFKEAIRMSLAIDN